AGAVRVPEDGHIDVHPLLWGYLHHAGRHGVEARCGLEVRGVRVENGRATAVVTPDGEIAARWIVNAAGAWAGNVAVLASAVPIPLVPHRRTIVVFDVPLHARAWPMLYGDAARLSF